MQSMIYISSLVSAFVCLILSSEVYAQKPVEQAKPNIVLSGILLDEEIRSFEEMLNAKLLPFVSGYDRFLGHIYNTISKGGPDNGSADVLFQLMDSNNRNLVVEVFVPSFDKMILAMSPGNYEFSKELLFNTVVGIFVSRIPKHLIRVENRSKVDSMVGELMRISSVFGSHPYWTNQESGFQSSLPLWSQIRIAVNYFNQSYKKNYTFYSTHVITKQEINGESQRNKNIFNMFQDVKLQPILSDEGSSNILSVALGDVRGSGNEEKLFQIFIPLAKDSKRSEMVRMVLVTMIHNLKFSPYTSTEYFPVSEPFKLACGNIFSIRSGLIQ